MADLSRDNLEEKLREPVRTGDIRQSEIPSVWARRVMREVRCANR